MTKKKLFAITMALLLVVTIPLAVLAETYDLSKGSITVEAKADGQYVSQEGGVQNEKQTTDTVIEQDKTESETTSNTIAIKAEKNTTAEVTISGVNIDQSNGGGAFATGGEGNVTIELEGENTLKSGSERAGLEKGNGGNLTIEDSDDDGSLTAVGGYRGAGIGGGYAGDGSDITITGGDVTATGGTHGAGIGGGSFGSGTDITIAGGNVTATSKGYGAGIGGGYSGDGSDITITGGNVDAAGGTGGAGIGGGHSGTGDSVSISGDAQVKVSGGKNAAAIGDGRYGNGEITPDTSALGKDGSVAYFSPNADKSKDAPEKLLHKTSSGTVTHNGISIQSRVAATCTQSGSITYLCSCGQTFTQFLSPLGHDLERHEAKAATCTETGWNEYDTCKRAGCTYTTRGADLPIDPNNHDLEHHEAKAATCTEDGWYEYDTCKRCDYTTYRKIDKLNHSFTNYVFQNDATCLEDGTEIAQCDRTGCTATDERTAQGTAMGHSFTDYVFQNDATCLEDGTEIAQCDHTGCTATDERTAQGTAMGHSFTDYVFQNDATCLEDGTEIAQCDHTGCTATDERTAQGTAMGHSFTDYVFQNDATCLEDGTEIAQCDHTGCTATDKRTAQGTAMGHSFTDYVFQNDATCLEDGTEIAQCDHTGCTATDERTAQGTAMGHSFTDYIFQNDATCLEDGTEIAQCDHTGCTATDERTAVGSATGHSFTDYVSNKDATYTQDGTETAECDHGCGETDTRTVEGSKLPLYRVTDENGKSVIHKANYSGNTLTITAELDSAILTGSTLALPVLQARGITTIVFVTNGTTSTFELADLLAKGEGTYALTHAGGNVTFLLNEEDIGSILK